MATIIDVAEFINKRKVSLFQVRILILCSIVMLIDGFDSQSMGFIVPMIAKSWGVAKPAFAPVFSAGLLGMALGALGFGVLADRFGRKNVVVFCTFYFAVLSLAKVTATSVMALLVIHFLACLGLGGAMSSAIALTAEYAPNHRRAMMVAIAGCAFSIGVSGSGLFAAKVVTVHGWQTLFYIGGTIPLILTPVMIVALPESIRFLILRRGSQQRLERILKKIDPSLKSASQLELVSSEKKMEGVPVSHLLTHGRAPSTLLLWMAASMDLVIIYFLTSWLPTILHGGGLSMERAELGATTYFAASIIGAPIVGRLMDRFGSTRMLALAFALASAFIFMLGSIGMASFDLLCFVLAGAGFFALGGHFGITALAGELYPTFMRSTGIGWALGIGRFCSLLSPMVGGMLLAREWTHAAIFSAVALPAFIAAVAIMLIPLVRIPEPAGGVPERLKAQAAQAD